MRRALVGLSGVHMSFGSCLAANMALTLPPAIQSGLPGLSDTRTTAHERNRDRLSISLLLSMNERFLLQHLLQRCLRQTSRETPPETTVPTCTLAQFFIFIFCLSKEPHPPPLSDAGVQSCGGRQQRHLQFQTALAALGPGRVKGPVPKGAILGP